MDVKEEYYGDGMQQIHFVGGLVRCDFSTIQPDTSGNNHKPTSQKKLRLVMNLPAFLRTFDTMKAMLDRMLEEGIVKKQLTEKLDD